MLVGANVHPWSDWEKSIQYVARSGGTIVRWDEQLPATPPADVAKRFDQVYALGLQATIVLVPLQPPLAVETVWADYLSGLTAALGKRDPILEIGNEPNYFGPWPADRYYRALCAAWNASGSHRIAMAGLAMNDRAYLAAMGNVSKVMDFANLHPYTNGGNPRVGPLAPDDLDADHQGRFSFLQGIRDMQARVGKPLILSEFGWGLDVLGEAQRASYFRAAVSIARANGVYALIAEEIGSGDGPNMDLTDTPSWHAFMEAARAP